MIHCHSDLDPTLIDQTLDPKGAGGSQQGKDSGRPPCSGKKKALIDLHFGSRLTWDQELEVTIAERKENDDLYRLIQEKGAPVLAAIYQRVPKEELRDKIMNSLQEIDKVFSDASIDFPWEQLVKSLDEYVPGDEIRDDSAE
jgi:hypothetical protein